MPRGIKGSGKSRTAKQPRKIEAAEKAPVKSTTSIFGAHSPLIDRIVLGAELAKIIEDGLSVLVSKLSAFDSRTKYDFGKKVSDKLIEAGTSALINLNVMGSTAHGVHAASERSRNLISVSSDGAVS